MQPLFLVGSGMITPIGAGAKMVNTSLQAGINRYQQSNIVGNDGELLRMALTPRNAWKNAINKKLLQGKPTPRQRRMLRLATLALQDLSPILPEQALPLFLAGPEFEPDSPGIDGEFIRNLAQQSNIDIDLKSCKVTSAGRAGVLNMIEMSFRYFEASDNYYAIVGGVDSFYDVKTMNNLDNAERLLTDSTFSGFVPGEGAGFLLLVSHKAPQEILQKAIANIHLPGIASETGHILSNGLFRGDGLSNAFKSAISRAQSAVGSIYSSENGEAHYTKEVNTALTRNNASFNNSYKVVRPAECLGDLGAAFGAVAIGVASLNLHDKLTSLVSTSSDSGCRAAVCMQKM